MIIASAVIGAYRRRADELLGGTASAFAIVRKHGSGL